MDCKEFQYWLTTRDIHDGQIPPWFQDHMSQCSQCRSLFEKDNILEQNIAAAFAVKELPRGIEERISLSLDHAGQNIFTRFTKSRRSLTIVGAGLAAILIIFALAFSNFRPPAPVFKDLNQITHQAVTDHLKGNRYMSFDAGETEQALAMLTQELGFSVILPDLENMGYTLLGGRLCALGECRAAYFIVKDKGKTGSLFIMGSDHIKFSMADGSRFTTSVKGCDTCIWKDHGQIYALVF